MPQFRDASPAFGHPGNEPRWTQGNKDGVGTAYSTGSRVWFTLFQGALTETYYPTIDRPQLRDLQLMISDGQSFFHEEKRHLNSTTERLWADAPGYRIINSDPQGRYSIEKEVIADPHLACVLQRMRLQADQSTLKQLKVYVLAAPHIEVSGWGNNARVIEIAGRKILVAERKGTWMAIAANVPFAKMSVGFVGQSDGWTDLNEDFQMNWEFDCALDGNVALTAQIAPGHTSEFVLALAFGDNFHQAVTTLFQSVDIPFDDQAARFQRQWARTTGKTLSLGEHFNDGGALYHSSLNVIRSHEDKTFPGAFIASLSVPWGEAKNAVEVDGYHLVWPRDMVNSATGLLAAGDGGTPLRALIYLATSQQADGGFPQNFWIDATPHWFGVQLDEVSFPILLAYYLRREGALRDFDPYAMVLRAAQYIIAQGPATQQERWEENSGYSPSTLAANIAALVCAAEFARERDDPATVEFILSYADWLESQLEKWTVTTQSTLVPGIARHYIRILPIDLKNPQPDENPNQSTLHIANHAPGAENDFPARDIVDAGFLHLVRFGIRRADDPLIVDSLRVVDELLKRQTPHGPCWRRYPHDGYGQREDGGPFDGWGVGRAWPLLTGERAHYELAAGGDVQGLRDAMERFASSTGLLPEQVWDEADRPQQHLLCGGPTGAAQPLVWAHAEYVKLLRSLRDGQVFDWIEEVAARYIDNRAQGCEQNAHLEWWKFNRQPRAVQAGSTLRIVSSSPFLLRWSDDYWQTQHSSPCINTELDFYYFDLPVAAGQSAPLRWTFFWPESNHWEGHNYEVAVVR